MKATVGGRSEGRGNIGRRRGASRRRAAQLRIDRLDARPQGIHLRRAGAGWRLGGRAVSGRAELASGVGNGVWRRWATGSALARLASPSSASPRTPSRGAPPPPPPRRAAPRAHAAPTPTQGPGSGRGVGATRGQRTLMRWLSASSPCPFSRSMSAYSGDVAMVQAWSPPAFPSPTSERPRLGNLALEATARGAQGLHGAVALKEGVLGGGDRGHGPLDHLLPCRLAQHGERSLERLGDSVPAPPLPFLVWRSVSLGLDQPPHRALLWHGRASRLGSSRLLFVSALICTTSPFSAPLE